ncbi:MAG: hypothetical protein JWL61_4789 [Gemmatimonadetes bacterium]|nr:hypothetical protein [Gemmatimonadota bacterium]
MITTQARTLLVATAISLAAAEAHGQANPCQRRTDCADVTTFTASVTDFRTSQQDRGTRLVTTTVRFQNKTTRPLILGYVQNSGIATDDQGNRFVVFGAQAVRGIGEIANTFDPKFVLQPGEASDARFEYVFRMPSASTILGTKYDVELAVREINPVAGNQFRLGREHAIQFRGFGPGWTPGGSVASQPVTEAVAQVANTPSPLPPEVDQCAGKTRCYGAGPFVVEVAQFTTSTEGNKRYHVLRTNVKVRNVSSQPIILAYKATSDGATDNLGNRYYWGTAGTYDMSVSGIGKVEGRNADPQFVLAPGESRTATFSLVRRDANGRELGTSWTQDLTLVQLEVLPSRQVRVGREYAVSFKDLSSGAADAGNAAAQQAGKKLFDAVRARVGKP